MSAPVPSFADRPKPDHDPVNHPRHYTQYQGLEIIDLTEQMNFNLGNAVKYLARAGFKDPAKEIEDLKKAQWYVTREIERREKALRAANHKAFIQEMVEYIPNCDNCKNGTFGYGSEVVIRDNKVVCPNCGRPNTNGARS